jgi:hypothetical protein
MLRGLLTERIVAGELEMADAALTTPGVVLRSLRGDADRHRAKPGEKPREAGKEELAATSAIHSRLPCRQRRA